MEAEEIQPVAKNKKRRGLHFLPCQKHIDLICNSNYDQKKTKDYNHSRPTIPTITKET